MGLEDFATSSSSSGSSSGPSISGSGSSSGSSSSTKSVDYDPMEPYFTVLVDTRRDKLRIHTGEDAFYEESRYMYERVITVIETQDEFERLDDLCNEYTGMNLPSLFNLEPTKAKDIVARFTHDERDNDTALCPVCDKELVLKDESYTKVFGSIVHSHHEVSSVLDELTDEE